MRTKLWVGVGAFVIAQSGQAALAAEAALPLATTADQVGEGGENERGEGEGEGERHVSRRAPARHVVKSPRRTRAAQQHRGQRGEGEYEGGENEGGEGEGNR
jgi:hypothetical protein